MEKGQFDDAFETGVAGPLRDVGFKPRGKSLAFKDASITIALIRLGGRLASPGCISHVICFRHSFLRDRSESVPAAAPAEPFDYPFKFIPSEAPPSRYRPQNLRYPYDVVEWSHMGEQELSRWTAALAATITDRLCLGHVQ
ncbi:hypothetical protein [Terricaulis sp.]|uniref:hypothetical protein n=1 Tax=Terricaulis sp. TaxID=2768686 RepID=UPI00378421CE